MGLDEDDLSNMWGYEQITWIEYQTKLKELSEFRENQQAFKDQPTKLSEYVRMLKRELNDVRIEIQELEEGLK